MATEKGITLYVNPNYEGNPVTLDVGTYRLGQLLSKGFINDSVSSIKVPPGYTVIVYEHNIGDGKKATYTADTPYVGDDMNDSISSVEVTYDAEAAKKDPTPTGLRWGTEKIVGDLDIILPDGKACPPAFPNNPNHVAELNVIINPKISGEYLTTIKYPEVYVRFDMKSLQTIEAVGIVLGFQTKLSAVRVGMHFDDKYTGQTLQLPDMTGPGWEWFDGKPMTEMKDDFISQVIKIPTTAARYVIIHMKVVEGISNIWRLRRIAFKGS